MEAQTSRPPLGMLFDRDGTLVTDVPYNGDPSLVSPLPGAKEVLAALRAAGIPTGVVSNQSGIARGLLTAGQVEAVNTRVDQLLGPFDAWCICPHGPDDGCECRKPKPGMIFHAARQLDIAPWDLALVGDIGADVEAAAAAGCRSVLVPTAVTLPQEVADAPEVAADLRAALLALFPEGTAVHHLLDAPVPAEARR